MVVLAAALPNQLGEPVVLVNVVANRLPEPLECPEKNWIHPMNALALAVDENRDKFYQ